MNQSGDGSGVGRRGAVAAIGAGAAASLATPAAGGQRTSQTAEERENLQTVSAFIAAWNAKDAARVMSFFAEDARFAVGPIGATPEFRKPDFAGLIENASSIKMTITPGTRWARGPVMTHEHVDDIVLSAERRITGAYIAVFTLRAGKIVDFLEFRR